jgi:general secretion pathway protein G
MSLVELLIVLAIVAILGAIGVPLYTDYMNKARNSQAMAQISDMESIITRFRVEHGTVPANLGVVGLAGRVDPWGRPYEYVRIEGLTKAEMDAKARTDRFVIPINSDFDLYSKGKDGASSQNLNAASSRDDIVRASNGGFIGKASDF